MADYKRTTEPTSNPIDLAYVKRHARIETTDEDDDIQSKINAAVRFVERQYSLAAITQTWTMTLDRFPADGRIYLPVRPVQSITSLKYTDTDGDQQTWSGANYRLLDADGLRPYITYIYNGAWPSSVRTDLDSIEVVWSAGYGDSAADVPADFRHALAVLVATYFGNREILDGYVSTGADYQLRDSLRGLGIVPEVDGVEC